jgi:hypothetical protein
MNGPQSNIHHYTRYYAVGKLLPAEEPTSSAKEASSSEFAGFRGVLTNDAGYGCFVAFHIETRLMKVSTFSKGSAAAP